ncbi:hypothetical protein BN59_01622 [Legionella massiliensis]|uniref:Uncharacterized protein n=1 Tax=Legionella massiliensis TaxID=1034943 RepID=A0A078KZV2_9GAMM|nr:hypothetical protein [Legionella massiliensis]CDZ77339.1 hypothetical protein BN59_01622 [Legionella massiliensis]CEE13077.1 hypothetical protein BN1094_01622 [Legionella massiliensis]
MKSKYLIGLLFLLMSQAKLAYSGLLFNITATGGAPGPISLTLCLNGVGALSCQIYSVNNLNLNILSTIPNHIYPAAGIKINTPGYKLTGCTMIANGYCLFAVSNLSAANIAITNSINTNAPWYPSLQAFEHYNSGRSHVFPQATFAGSMSGNNTVNTLNSTSRYPSGYNMSYLNNNLAYIYGGGYGDVPLSIGAYVAQVNPDTLEPIWRTQLIDTHHNGEWDYPGSLGILEDGYLYVSYGYRLAKLDPATGKVISILVLPTGGGLPENTSFNGFNATQDGTIVMKSVYRQAGCTIQGPNALLDCPDPTDVPPSILVSVNPKTMQWIHQITLTNPVGARPTVTRYNGKDYVYLLEATTAIRYIVQNGVFIADSSWNPGTITLAGQTLCTSFVVVNDWVIAQTNTLPATTALSVISINQGNAANQFSIQPFLGDPISPLIAAAFSPSISWAPMSISGDSDTNLIYASDALPGKIAAISISNSGLQIVWKADQRTTEFTALINPPLSRVIVGTDIPDGEIPGNNHNDYAVWRNALTGEEIARSPLLPAMTQGTMIQPYYSGNMFYEGQLGDLIKLSPVAPAH